MDRLTTWLDHEFVPRGWFAKSKLGVTMITSVEEKRRHEPDFEVINSAAGGCVRVHVRLRMR